MQHSKTRYFRCPHCEGMLVAVLPETPGVRRSYKRVCPVCGKRYQNSTSLLRHLWNSHRNPSIPNLKPREEEEEELREPRNPQETEDEGDD